MEIQRIKVGVYQSNCYLLRKNNEIVIIDPGANFERISSFIKEDDHVLAVLLTHGHFDHISVVDECVNSYHCPVYVSKDELDIIRDPEKNYALNKKSKVSSDVLFFEHQLSIGNFNFDIHETPGHTIGSVCIECDGHLFSGDTLFKGSVGRTDLYSSNYSDLKQSLKYLKTLSADLLVHPGHEGSSTLEQEFKSNPYLK